MPGARWPNYAAKVAVAGVVLAAVAAGCSRPLAWISYLATGVTGLAWAACGLLIPVAGLGMTLVFLAAVRSPVATPPTARPGPTAPAPVTTAAAARPGDVRPPPALVVAAHITAASITILLAVLAAIGSG